jgi:NitT/TauT family transport system substrate-binding protein
MEERGLTGKINIVEMNPPDMASALASGALDAYYVGEPFAAQTLRSGDASLIHYVEDVWKYFICNLVLVRQDFIENDPEIVQMLVQGAARSGIWARENPHTAARIASEYWNQPFELVEYALTTPEKRIVYDRFIPKREEMQHMANLMMRFKLIEHNKISGLIDDSFANAVDLSGITDITSIFQSGQKMTSLQGNIKPNPLQ